MESLNFNGTYCQVDDNASMVDSSEFGSNDSDMESLSTELYSLNYRKNSSIKMCTSKLVRQSKNMCGDFRPISRASSDTRDRRSSKRSYELPLYPLPVNVPGIMWCGPFHRIPVFIFSKFHVNNKSDVVENLGRIFNMTFRLVRIESKLLRSILNSHGFQESLNHLGRFNLLWTGSHLNPYQLRLLADFHKINHFPRSYELTRKDRLAKNVQKMQKMKGVEYFDFIPQSFILPDDFREFCGAYLQDRGLFIVKPIASSRGRGIFIISHPEEVPFDEPCIVSRYITNPYLIDGFKFDVRIYVAVTSYEPLVIYIYEEGLVRFATIRYQSAVRHLRTQCMHLTNYSVNKKSFEFVQNNDENVEDFGNKWSLGALLRFLQADGVDATGLMLRIEEIIIKSFLCVQTPVAAACGMYQACKGRCFELYGFDIIVDEDLRPWLLEVNLSPSLNCDSPLDHKVKSHMLTDLFNLVGIACHDPTRKTQGGTRSRLHVMANGLTALPTKLSTYFVTAQEQVASHLKASIGIPSKHQAYRSRSSSSSAISLQDQDTFLSGINVAEFLHPDLTVEEAKLIRRLQEEACRAGGWIRLLPNPEAWEQYSSIWPNESGQCYSSLDRTTPYDRAGSRHTAITPTSAFLSRTHELTSDSQRISMNSSLVSAYCAASAVAMLNSITASVYAKQFASKSIKLDQTSGIGLACSQSASGLNSPETSLHPNNCRITVHLASYLQKKTTHRRKPDKTNQQVHRRPSVDAVDQSRLALHSLSPLHLQNCLNAVLTSDSAKSSGDSPSRQDYQRTVACYKHTTSHMPFYLRQLGQPPQSIAGVYLSVQLDSLQSDSCPATTKKRAPTTKTNNASVRSRRAASGRTATVSTLSGLSSTSFERPLHCSTPERPESESSSKPSALHTEPTGAKRRVSVIQARHAFAAYLSRINDRLLAESVDPNPPVDPAGDEKQINLLCRFLNRVALTLSSEAVTTVCCKNWQSTDLTAGVDRPGVFTVPTLDKTKPIKERKSLIADCLGLFIQIYQYETVAILSPRNRHSQTGEELDSREFWQFIHEANEAQLEEFLTTYTHSNQTMRNILRPTTPGSAEDTAHFVAKPQLLTPISRFPVCLTSSNVSEPTKNLVMSRSVSRDPFDNDKIEAFEGELSYDGEVPQLSVREDAPKTPVTKLSAWTSCCIPPSDGFGDSNPENQASDDDVSSVVIPSAGKQQKDKYSLNRDILNDTQTSARSNKGRPMCKQRGNEKASKVDDKTMSSWQSTLCLPLRKIRTSSLLSSSIKSSSSGQQTTVDSYSQTSKGRITMRPSRNRMQNESRMYSVSCNPNSDLSPKRRPRFRNTGPAAKRCTSHRNDPTLPLYQIRSTTPKTDFHAKVHSRDNSLYRTSKYQTYAMNNSKLPHNSFSTVSHEDELQVRRTPSSLSRIDSAINGSGTGRRRTLKPNNRPCQSRKCTPIYRSNATRCTYPAE